MSDLAKKSTKADLEALQSYPHILLEAALRKQDVLNQLMGMKKETVSCQSSVDESVAYDDFIDGTEFGVVEGTQIAAALAAYLPMKRVLEKLLQALS